MTSKTRFLIVTSLFVGAFLFSASGASAANNGPKPGWGWGDKNHVHTGPPGLSVRPQPPRPAHLPHWFFEHFHKFFSFHWWD